MLALFLSLAVWAQESPLPLVQGDYRTSSAFEITAQRKWEPVSLATSEGSARLEELKSQGYDCHSETDVQYICYLSVKGPQASAELEKAFREKWGQVSFSFYKLVGKPSFLSNSEFYKEWSVPQKVVKWQIPHVQEANVWNPVSYTWTIGDRWQVYLGSASSSVYIPISVEQNQTLTISDFFVFQNGNQFEKDFVLIPLEKVQP